MIKVLLGIHFNTINITDSNFVDEALVFVSNSLGEETEHRQGKDNLIITVEDYYPYVSVIKIVDNIEKYSDQYIMVNISAPSSILELCDGNGESSSLFKLSKPETQISFYTPNDTDVVLSFTNLERIIQLDSEDFEGVLMDPEVDLSTMTLLNEPSRISFED